MAISIGENWGPIWQDGVWNTSIWKQSSVVTPIGKNWKAIWAPNVWNTAIWSQVAGSVSEVLLPSIEVSNVGWVLTGAANIVTALSDGLDTSFVQSQVVDDAFTVSLNAPVTTFTAITGATLKVRAKKL